ncbi:MAG TPA: hypothetical protein PLU64_07730, partial [Saprospiraceae bacterium]|nr:hypothetical protein [Saprospiraceae bacterium]
MISNFTKLIRLPRIGWSAPVAIALAGILALVVFSMPPLSREADASPFQQPSLSLTLESSQAAGELKAPEIGLNISAPEPLGRTRLELFSQPATILGQQSINKVVGIHPARNHALQAQLAFQYDDDDLNGLDETKLILYSSTDNGRTWEPHLNSVVDPENNSIHLNGIEHFSLWTAAPLPPIPAPGGVDAGLAFWSRADVQAFSDAGVSPATDGASVQQWNDISGSGFHTTQATVGQRPTYRDGIPQSNYNPYLFWNDDHLENTSPILDRLNDDITMIGVGFSTVNSGINSLAGLGNNGNDPTLDVTGLDFNPWADNSSPAFVTHIGSPVIQDEAHILDIRAINGLTTLNDDLVAGLDGYDHANNMDIRGQTNTQMFNQIHIGSDGGGEDWDGGITEIVIYNRRLDGAELARVRSYLAIRNGVTLDNDPANPTVNYDYLASDGAIIWPGTSTAGYQPYHQAVAGIGRDDNSMLDQRKSNSVKLGSVVSMENSGGFGTDRSYLVWGHNGAAATYANTYTPNSFTPAAGYFRMARVWRVKETGTVGAITVIGPATAEHLLVHNSANFNSGAPTEIAMTPDGNGNMAATVNFT